MQSSLFPHLMCGKNVGLYYFEVTSKAPFQNQGTEAVQVNCSICGSAYKRKNLFSCGGNVAVYLLPQKNPKPVLGK